MRQKYANMGEYWTAMLTGIDPGEVPVASAISIIVPIRIGYWLDQGPKIIAKPLYRSPSSVLFLVLPESYRKPVLNPPPNPLREGIVSCD